MILHIKACSAAWILVCLGSIAGGDTRVLWYKFSWLVVFIKNIYIYPSHITIYIHWHTEHYYIIMLTFAVEPISPSLLAQKMPLPLLIEWRYTWRSDVLYAGWIEIGGYSAGKPSLSCFF